MWPPSSGSTGSRFSSPSARLTRPSTNRKSRSALPPRLRGHTNDADRARDLVRVPSRRQMTDAADRVGGDAPGQLATRRRSRAAATHPGPCEPRSRSRCGTRRCPALPAAARARPACPCRSTIDLERLALRSRGCAWGCPSASTRWPAMRRICVALPGGARRPRGCPASDAADDVRVLLGRDQEERCEEHDREHEVHGRPRKDRGQAPPGRLPPVRVRRERPLELLPHPRRAERWAKRLQLGVRGAPSPRARSRSRAARAPGRYRSRVLRSAAPPSGRPATGGSSPGSSRSRRAGSSRCRTRPCRGSA